MADAEVLVSIALYRPAWGAAPSCENGQCWLLLALPFFYALISVPQTNVFIHSVCGNMLPHAQRHQCPSGTGGLLLLCLKLVPSRENHVPFGRKLTLFSHHLITGINTTTHSLLRQKCG